MRSCLVLFGVAAAVLSTPVQAEPRTASFAIVVGVNKSHVPDQAPLRYADDDAARFFDLFRTLGLKVDILAELDGNTRALHTQAAAEAVRPDRQSLDFAIVELRRAVGLAKQRGLRTVVYFTYAGHGETGEEELRLSLSDTSIAGQELLEAVASIDADAAHIIVDACGSYYLALSRGPGGTRRPLHGFASGANGALPRRVGLLLSTSSANESHEWEAWQSGVFSQEVRSGLYGAADADSDGRVSYREIAAFVSTANAGIVNERYRPKVFARAPEGTDDLLELGMALDRRIEIDPGHAGHYYLEDPAGVRLAEFHTALGTTARLVRPTLSELLFLRQVGTSLEYRIPSGDKIVRIAALEPSQGEVTTRGAAHEAFRTLFSRPFDVHDVVDARMGALDPLATVRDRRTPQSRGLSRRGVAGLTLSSLGLVSLVVGGVLSGQAVQTSTSLPAVAPQQDVERRNQSIHDTNAGAAASYALGAAVVAVGLAVWLWPAPKRSSSLFATPVGVGVTF